jgi:hypothetical protein
MRSPRIPASILAAALSGTLLLGACGGSSDDASTPTTAPSSASGGGAGADAEDALASQVPDATVEVPSADGATTIAEYAAGGSSFEPADPSELAKVLAMVGTDAEGYITDDAIVVEQSEADATLLCGTVDGLGISTYTVIPVLPDGTGVDCG